MYRLRCHDYVDIDKDEMDKIIPLMKEDVWRQVCGKNMPCSNETLLWYYLELEPDFEEVLKNESDIDPKFIYITDYAVNVDDGKNDEWMMPDYANWVYSREEAQKAAFEATEDPEVTEVNVTLYENYEYKVDIAYWHREGWGMWCYPMPTCFKW